MRKSLALLTMVSLCACASAQRNKGITKASDYKSADGTAVASKGQVKPKGNMICEEEMPVGSHIPKQVCRYQDDLDLQREDAQEFLHAHPTVNPKGGGG